ncbi:unnamed protein product [Pleuronectes platessa]|uniref:Uncharacterized protein n=1 Tax=Pleuronectes platessa TaxID=8262 RepID=A0A9N7ZCD8_PLEPL|nr:unnamed protein product [Pleuronectes platessa]
MRIRDGVTSSSKLNAAQTPVTTDRKRWLGGNEAEGIQQPRPLPARDEGSISVLVQGAAPPHHMFPTFHTPIPIDLRHHEGRYHYEPHALHAMHGHPQRVTPPSPLPLTPADQTEELASVIDVMSLCVHGEAELEDQVGGWITEEGGDQVVESDRNPVGLTGSLSDISLIRLSPGAVATGDSPFSAPHPYVHPHMEHYLRSVHASPTLSMIAAARGLSPADREYHRGSNL